MPKINPRTLAIVFVFFLSCTIIEDDDIQTLEELGELVLAGFEISEQGSPILSFTLTADSAINVPDPAWNTVVKRISWYSAPSLGTSKVKYKSGASSNLKISMSYLANDKPYTWVLWQGDSAVEIYRFRYTTGGQLTRVITILNPVDSKPATYHTQDDFTYSNNSLQSITRTSATDVSKQGTFGSFLLNSINGTNQQSLSGFNFQSYNVTGNPGSCPNNSDGVSCRGYQFFAGSGGGGNSVQTTIKQVDVFNRASSLQFQDHGAEDNSCCRDPDTYYLHPLMYWNFLMDRGNILLAVYMIDWISPGPINTSGGNQNQTEYLTINYQYAN
jgi:hypothetical protein